MRVVSRTHGCGGVEIVKQVIRKVEDERIPGQWNLARPRGEDAWSRSSGTKQSLRLVTI